MRVGRGRLIAGRLTPELRRLYEPSPKYGRFNPLIYSATICPSCYYAALAPDFIKASQSVIEKLQNATDTRHSELQAIFPDLNFQSNRRLSEGIAAYYAAMSCYEHFSAQRSIAHKQAICSLRAAWLSHDLHIEQPDEHFDSLAIIFYRKAAFLYKHSIENEQNIQKEIGGEFSYGPDIDKNWGFDGMVYVSTILNYQYNMPKNPIERSADLRVAKKNLSSIFGMGQASRLKPSELLEMSKNLFNTISAEIKTESDA